MLIAAFALMLWQGQKAQKQAWDKAQHLRESKGQETQLNESEDDSISPMGSLSSDKEPSLIQFQDSMDETISTLDNDLAITPSDNNRFSVEPQSSEEIYALENNFIPVAKITFGTPQLSKSKINLYPSIMNNINFPPTTNRSFLLQVLNLAEGKKDLLDICLEKKFKLVDHIEIIKKLLKSKYITKK